MSGREYRAECVVLGGGPAGAMAGLRLAKAGRNVLLVERERAAHTKVCGEFLSPEAVYYLRSAGVDPVALGAVAIHRLRILAGRRTIAVELPFTALSLSRTVLDEVLLSRAAAAGCRVLRGAAVESLAANENCCRARLSDGAAIEAPAAFLATGKHDLRGWPRPAGRQNDLVGFKLHLRLTVAQTAELRGIMDLFLFRGGYGGLSLVENGIANLCLVVRRDVLRALRGGWPELLLKITAENAGLRARLDAAQPLWERPLAISPIPYGHLGSGKLNGVDGLWPVGDQAAVIPSFTGDGMSIALHSATLASESFLAGESPSVYQRKLVAQLRGGMALAITLSRAMVTNGGQTIAPAVLSLLPGTLRLIAARTRIPAQALEATQ